MNSKEFIHLVKEIELLKNEFRNLFTVLLDLKVIKIKEDKDGKLVYDNGKDE